MDRERLIALKGLMPDELQALLSQWGEPAYRGKQLAHWLYRQGARSFDEMHTLPERLRVKLAEKACLVNGEIIKQQVSADGTAKYLMSFPDKAQIEFVLIPEAKRLSLCLSSQVGCGFACAFCATGQAGLIRNLSAGEIVEQALLATRVWGQRPTNIIFMGMGEPLANFQAVMRAVALLNHPDGFGLGMRHLTISTCGIVPRIYELAERQLQLTLAISLHAADDETRSKLMPINKQYPLAELMACARAYAQTTKRRVTFEYTLIAGVNDRDKDFIALGKLLAGWLCHLNLIPVNPTHGQFFPPTPTRVRLLAQELSKQGISVSIRNKRGVDIAAACGQLRGESGKGKKEKYELASENRI